MFRFNEGFLGRLKRFEDLEGMEGLLRETSIGFGIGHLNQLECSAIDFLGEVTWNFGYWHVLDFQILVGQRNSRYRRWQAFVGWGAVLRQGMSKQRGRKCGDITFWGKCIHLPKTR